MESGIFMIIIGEKMSKSRSKVDQFRWSVEMG